MESWREKKSHYSCYERERLDEMDMYGVKGAVVGSPSRQRLCRPGESLGFPVVNSRCSLYQHWIVMITTCPLHLSLICCTLKSISA